MKIITKTLKTIAMLLALFSISACNMTPADNIFADAPAITNFTKEEARKKFKRLTIQFKADDLVQNTALSSADEMYRLHSENRYAGAKSVTTDNLEAIMFLWENSPNTSFYDASYNAFYASFKPTNNIETYYDQYTGRWGLIIDKARLIFVRQTDKKPTFEENTGNFELIGNPKRMSVYNLSDKFKYKNKNSSLTSFKNLYVAPYLNVSPRLNNDINSMVLEFNSKFKRDEYLSVIIAAFDNVKM